MVSGIYPLEAKPQIEKIVCLSSAARIAWLIKSTRSDFSAISLSIVHHVPSNPLWRKDKWLNLNWGLQQAVPGSPRKKTMRSSLSPSQFPKAPLYLSRICNGTGPKRIAGSSKSVRNDAN
jgi:hypothetical protein